jgi:hypothetical protein
VVIVLKVPLLVLSVAVALVFSAESLAAVKAADPGSRVDVTIDIFDTTSRDRYGLAYVIYLMKQSDYTHSGFMNDPVEVSVGDVARFNVRNKGKKAHILKVFGVTRTVKPGAKAVFIVSLLKRDSFPYVIDKGTKGFKGIFLVN